MAVRVWLPASGVVLVYRADGFPMPPLDYAARAALDPPVSKWPWDRDDVWPCSHVEMPTDIEPWLPFRFCRRLAVHRHGGPSTRGYYCAAHVPTKPSTPVSLCAMCTGPMDPAAVENGHDTHRGCNTQRDQATDEDWQQAMALFMNDPILRPQIISDTAEAERGPT
jgi:hypothetical protein